MDKIVDLLRFAFWAAVFFPILAWPFWYLRKRKCLKEEELVGISPKFKGISSSHYNFQFWGALPIVLVSIVALGIIFTTYRLMGEKFIAPPLIITFGYAFSQGLFALVKGVYPKSSSMFFYAEGSTIRNVALLQISFAVMVVAVFVVAAYIW